jgi:osmotically-inducible protein OsmY
MKSTKAFLSLLTVVALGTLAACSTAPTKAADVTESIRVLLDQAGLQGVSVSQDRDHGVVILGGHVDAYEDKLLAASVASSIAGAQVVANEIAVVPPGAESAAKDVNSALDDGIDSNLVAALIMSNLQDSVQHTVKNHVVTLTGSVNSQLKRTTAAEVAAAVPNVEQVINKLQVENARATSSQ